MGVRADTTYIIECDVCGDAVDDGLLEIKRWPSKAVAVAKARSLQIWSYDHVSNYALCGVCTGGKR